MDDMASEAPISINAKLARYQPEELAAPILPEPTREDFLDSKSRLKQIVSDQFVSPGRISDKYRYTSLKENEIRLLYIEPGEGDGEIRCEMMYGRLDDPSIAQRYHALSYHWGFDRPTNRIKIVDDRVNKRPPRISLAKKDKFASLVTQTPLLSQNNEWWFLVRDNLFSALRGLRQKDKPLLLWVDAVCINQDPTDEQATKEKQQQVGNMAQIYNTANSVCIWLGEGEKKTDRAMDFIKEVVKDIPGLDRYFSNGKQRWADWLAFKELLTFKWFSRRWVVQEVALARRASVHCGKKKMNWDDFADGIALFVNRMEQVNKAQQMTKFAKDPSKLEDVAALGANVLVTTLSNLSRKTEDGDILERLVGLETLVSNLIYFEASNPHDYIYSLLALARDTPKQNCDCAMSPTGAARQVDIEVDYEKDPLELFKDFTEQCIQTSKSLDIICRHWAPDVEGKDQEGMTTEVIFPSWILKVSQSSYGTAQDTLQGRRVGDSLVGCPYRDMRKTYNAANGTEAIYAFGEPPEDCLLRRFTDLSDTSHDSLSTKRVDFSISMSMTLSRKTTLNESTDQRDWANFDSVLNGQQPSEEPGEIQERKDSGTFPRPSPTRTPSNTSLRTDVAFQNILYVMGVQLGRIKKRSSRITNGTVPVEWLEVTNWRRGKPGLVPDMLWRTLVADRGPDGQFPPRWYRRACSHCLSDQDIMTPNSDLNTQKSPSSSIMAQFLSRVKSVVFSRQFFAGGNQSHPLFGLAPHGAEKGDLICVLAGCTVPVVLRKRQGPDGSCHFEFIGEAYVYGKMDGEAMSDLSCSNTAALKKELVCFPLI